MIHGTVAPGFEKVREQFVRNFEEAGEIGAAVCVIQDGQSVVDLWGGTADVRTETPWSADTLINTFSVSKGVVAHALLYLEDRGEIDIDEPVASFWPEFGRAGKERITTRMILNHRSGVVAVDRPLNLTDIFEWTPVEDALADQAPRWEPDTDQGYHAVTWGMLVRAIVRRRVGRPIGDVLREIAEPLHADVFLGVPDAELSRCADLVPPTRAQAALTLIGRLFQGGLDGRFFRNVLLRPGSDASRAVSNPRALGGFGFLNYNRDDVRQTALPWANLHASARGLARIYAPLASDGEAFGVRTVSEQAAVLPRAPQTWSDFDRVMRKPMGWSQGFIKEQPTLFSPNPGWMGHPGTGGCLGFADPDAGISFGYVMNKMRTQVRSPTALALSRSVYDCLGTPVQAVDP